MIQRTIAIILLIGRAIINTAYAADYNIIDYGAKGDGKTLSTTAIQKAIDACTANGGGRVIVPGGTFLTGTIQLKNNVDLHLESSATILGSIHLADYPLTTAERGLVMALDQHHVSISGSGEINGNGRAFFKGDNSPDRPLLVIFKKCHQVKISGVDLKSPAFWTLRLQYNDDVMVSGIHIYSHSNYNNDGIDIDSRNVVVNNCVVDTDDDALCFKSDSSVVCENVTVTNCILASNCNFIKMGTASFGGFKNISVTNCTLRKASESNFRFWNKAVPGVRDAVTGLAGIAIESVDGAAIDGINISNIVMNDVQTPIFIRLGNRRNNTGFIKNVLISQIIANTHSTIPSSITAIPGFYVENVTIDHVVINNLYGHRSEPDTMIPEKIKDYPENRMFDKTLPASGIYVRHAKEIFIGNFRVAGNEPDTRPVIYAEDVIGLNIQHLATRLAKAPADLLWLNQVSEAKISGSGVRGGGNNFLRLQGEETNEIELHSNSLEGFKRKVLRAKEVGKRAVFIDR